MRGLTPRLAKVRISAIRGDAHSGDDLMLTFVFACSFTGGTSMRYYDCELRGPEPRARPATVDTGAAALVFISQLDLVITKCLIRRL